VAKVKQAITHYEMTMPVPAGGYWYGGVLVGFDDSNNYVGYVAGSDGLSVIRVKSGSLDWRWAGPSLPVPAPGGSYAWSVDYSGTSATVTVNGVTVTENGVVHPAGGAFVDGSDLLFTHASWR
jgi:hypothetical protein